MHKHQQGQRSAFGQTDNFGRQGCNRLTGDKVAPTKSGQSLKNTIKLLIRQSFFVFLCKKMLIKYLWSFFVKDFLIFINLMPF